MHNNCTYERIHRYGFVPGSGSGYGSISVSISGSGYGYGYGSLDSSGDGFGHGFGSAYGCAAESGFVAGSGASLNGFGYGSISRFVSEYESGYGSRYGSVSVSVSGSGSGYGYGSGSISGSGYGSEVYSCVGGIKDYQIIVYKPWPVIRIGCEIHSISTWENQWKEIASKYSIDVDPDTVMAILSKACKLCSKETHTNG